MRRPDRWAMGERFAKSRRRSCVAPRSFGSVVELWDVERPCPLLAAPREDFGLRREPLVEAIESAFLHVNVTRTVLQVVGDHPGTAVRTEDAIEPLVRTCFGVRTVGEALGASAQHGEIRFRHHHPCCHLCAGRPLAIRAVAVPDEGWLRIEPVSYLATGTVTGVFLAHVISPQKRLWKFQIVEQLYAALGNTDESSKWSKSFTPRSVALRPLAGLVPVTRR